MSELLLHWLNHDLQLSTYVTDLESDFSSGYLLGEILHRLNHQHNFSDFMDSAIADAKIINFCLLEPSLRHLRVPFDAKVATAIMNGRRGVAANVLYQIKMAAERLARAPEVSTRSWERQNIRPLHNMPSRLAKPAYDAANHHIFEHSVRRHVKSLAGLKRERDAIAAEQRAKEAHKASQARLTEELEITKAERLHRAFIHSQYIKTALDETDSPAWRRAIDKKNEREQRRSAFYQQLAAERARKQDEQTYSLRHTVQTDLDEFERRGSPSTGSTKPAARKSLGYGLRSLSTTLQRHPGDSFDMDPAKPIPTGDTPASLNNSAMIKDQKKQRERRREQFERRRKRFLQETLNQHAHLNACRVRDGLESLVTRSTPREVEASVEMSKILVYKDIAVENRTRREESYARRRDSDHDEAVQRDQSAWELQFAKYNDDGEVLDMERQQHLQARDAARKHENQLVAGLLMQELVEFTTFIAGQREATMHARDPSVFLYEQTWEEHKFRFSAWGILDAAPEPSLEGDDPLSRHEFRQYIDHFLSISIGAQDYVGGSVKGSALSPWVPQDWKLPTAKDIPEDRFVLGETVKYVRWLASRAAECPEYLPKPSPLLPIRSDPVDTPASTTTSACPEVTPLRILLFGPPFSGKTTQARILADRYQLTLISVERALEKAIEQGDPLGTEARALLARGKEIPVAVYSQLVLRAVEASESPRRWIVYDLPATAEQAESLETHLTGFVDPTKIPSPFDHESAIAPGCAKPRLPRGFLHGKSGVDLVFFFQCVDATVLERCLGELADGATGERCHMLSTPPPEDSTDRHRLRHVNTTTNSSELLSLQCLATREFADEHQAGFERFNTLREVAMTDSSLGQRVAITRALTPEAATEVLVGHVETFFRDQEATCKAQLEARERGEREAMQEEEDRDLRLQEFKRNLTLAQDEVVRAQQAVQQAEEAKAKKEELAELRVGIDAAKKRVEGVLIAAHEWLVDESFRQLNRRTIYSSGLSPALGEVLARTWDEMENAYTAAMCRYFALERRQRQRVDERAAAVVEGFCAFVQRGDRKQVLVNAFQGEFNAVVEEMRFDEPTKHELHARVDVLQDELVGVVEAKRQESDEELTAIMADGWLEDTVQLVAVIAQSALQAECDRFRVTLQLLLDALLAASDEPAHLLGVVEQLRLHPTSLEIGPSAFLDDAKPPDDAPGAPAAAGNKPAAAAPAKGAKGKPPLAPTPSVPASAEAPAAGEALSVEELLRAYDGVLQRCDALVQLVLTAPAKPDEPPTKAAPEPAHPPPTKTSGKTGTTPAATPTQTPASSAVALPRQSIDVPTSNFHKAIAYEHGLLQRRVRFLRDHAHAACEHVQRSMRTIEGILRGVLTERADREACAVAWALRYIRSAIEREEDLPLYINTQPEQVYRFPTTAQLREDTVVRVDPTQRLRPRAAVPPPPTIEPRDPVALNPRQARELRDRLVQLAAPGPEDHDSGSPGTPLSVVVPLCGVVDVLVRATAVPDALPRIWRAARAPDIARLCSTFADRSSGLLDVDVLVTGLMNDPASVRSALPLPPGADD